jgi:hypothetical protein
MSKRIVSWVPTACVGLLAAATLLGTNRAAPAGNDCLAGPNRAPGQGGHWYYHLDHASNRKCWYVAEPEARSPTAQAAEPQPAPDPVPQPPQPTFGTFFSSLGFPGAQPNTAGDVRVAQPAPADDLKTDLAAPARRSRMLRHPDAEAALAPKPHRPAHARPPAEHADEGAAPPLNQAERDALFQEFLRWRESRTP